MKFLLDAKLSPQLIAPLRAAGHDAIHVAALDLLSVADEVIFERAARHHWTVVTADTDFSMLLALRRSTGPSVVLLRRVAELPWSAHAELLIANIDAVLDDLDRGAIVSLSPTRLAVRLLPMEPHVEE